MRFCFLFTCAIFSIVFGPLSHARIGETKADMGERMFTITQRAYVYNSKEDRLREALELPYKNIIPMFPAGVEHIFMFKNAAEGTSSQGDTIQQHDLYGWELHVVFYKGKSVLEFYRRHGDPMTVEEAEALMFAVRKAKTNSPWEQVDDAVLRRSWNYTFKDGKLSLKTKNDAKTLRQMLPESSSRYIFVEIPEDVKNDGKYKLSLVSDMMVIEQRKANDKYRNYISKKAQEKSAKSSKNRNMRKNAPPKITPFNGKSHKYVSQTFYDEKTNSLDTIEYYAQDVMLGNRAPVDYDKSIDIVTYLPPQDETAFGYTFQTQDKSIRAKLFDKGILFIDAEFDKEMRAYMDKLYLKQSNQRKDDAQRSTSSF